MFALRGFDIDYLQQIINSYNINLINLIFIVFIITIVIFGSLITLVEFHLPDWLRQSFRYGKHKHTGAADPLVSILEIPKSYFRHFYNFAIVWSLCALYLLVSAILTQQTAPKYVIQFLDLVAGGSKRQIKLDSNTALIAAVLVTMQCLRRFYETNFVQIFSKSSKINLSHYIVGYAHYFGVITALLANTEGFVHGTQPSPLRLTHFTSAQIACIAIFIFAWAQQYIANMVFVNLRKDAKTGRVKTEQHLVPSGGFFQLITSPHMFFEILMYWCLSTLAGNTLTWILIFCWVLSNQIPNALLTHQWYRQKFENYPEKRRAIIPFLL